MLKVAVFGNRNITDNQKVIKLFLQEINFNPSTLQVDIPIFIQGGAIGPQQIIIDYFKDQGYWVPTILFKPWHMIWSKLEFNPIFFYLRNKQIVENADKIIVFTNGEKDSEVYRVIGLCERRNKDFVIIEV